MNICFPDGTAAAEEAAVHGFEDDGVFEGVSPLRFGASRHRHLRFGPLKPVGLLDPKTDGSRTPSYSLGVIIPKGRYITGRFRTFKFNEQSAYFPDSGS